MRTRARTTGSPHLFLVVLFAVAACGDAPTAPAFSGEAPEGTAPALRNASTTTSGETGETLFAVSWLSDRLSTVDPATGDATNVGADELGFQLAQSLAIRESDGTLVSWDNGVRGLITIDRETGVGTRISEDQGSVGALAFAPDGRLLALETGGSLGRVRNVDPATGVLGVEVAELGFGPAGADVGPDGKLYVLGSGQQLATVDVASGVVTSVGTLSVDPGDAGSIAFDGDGRLLGVANRLEDGLVVTKLFSVNPKTAEVSGVRDVTGTLGVTGTVFDSPPRSTDDFFLFGHDNSVSKIVRIDLSTGSETSVGPTGFQSNATGMATARADVPGPEGETFPAGTQFGLFNDDATGVDWIVVVDTENGGVVKVVEAERDIAGRGIAFGPDGATLYLIERRTGSGLSTVSTVDGSVTPVGGTLQSASLQWDPEDGTLVAIENGSLYRIDPATGEATVQGTVGLDVATVSRSPGGAWITHSTADGSLYGLEVTTPWAWKIGGSGLAQLGGSAFAPVRPAPVNEPPENVSAGGPYSGTEGAEITFEAAGSDPEGTTVTFAWDFGDGSTATGAIVTHAYADDGVCDVTLTATDGDGISRVVGTTATVANVAPGIVSVTGPVDPQPVGTEIVVETSFGDPGSGDTHEASVDWGDGSTSTLSGVASPFQAAHTYTAAGVYAVAVTVTDDDGGSDTDVFEFVTVYDPEAGFVTGSGQIESPPGAYAPDPTLSGTARFGFSSRYRSGATTPDGRTQFHFRAADLRFVSESYEWLVVSGARAQFKGAGRINRSGDYGFLLTAVDGDLPGGGGADRFRLKIWDRDTDEVVYDNELGAEDDTDPTTTLQRGKITIHP